MNIKLSTFAVVCIVMSSAYAEAQVQPFQVSGSGVAEYVPLPGQAPAVHDCVGEGTYLGRYTGIGAVRTEAFTGPTTAAFSSAVPFVFTAANGDDLAFHYGRPDFGAAAPGEVEIFPADGGKVIAVWFAEFNPVPGECSGRFANVVAGSVFMIAITEPFVLGSDDPVGYSWAGRGWIEFE